MKRSVIEIETEICALKLFANANPYDALDRLIVVGACEALKWVLGIEEAPISLRVKEPQ